MSEQKQRRPNSSTKTGDSNRQCLDGTEGLDLPNLSELIIESLSRGVVAFDRRLRIIHANSQAGKLIHVGEYIDKSLAGGTDANIWGSWTRLLKSAITTGEKGDFKAVRYNLNGQKKLLHIVCTPLKESKTCRLIGGAVVIEDETDKVDIEHHLAQVERFAALGKVAGKVAHELNNPMDGILRYINLAIRVIEGGNFEKAGQYLQQCRLGLMRMVQIICELLEFSRSTRPAFERAPIDRIVAEAVKAMESVAKGIDVRIIRDCPGDMPWFRTSNLFQVFSNLVKNAADAMEGAGELNITIRCGNDLLEVEFRDTGSGFATEDAEAIFEPFFTTKTHGRGTGLGLAICKDIVEKHNGRITAQNGADCGSIFTVHLPLTKENRTQNQ